MPLSQEILGPCSDPLVSSQEVRALVVFEHSGMQTCVFHRRAVGLADHFLDEPSQGHESLERRRDDVSRARLHAVLAPWVFSSIESTEVGVHVHVEIEHVVGRLDQDPFVRGPFQVAQDGLHCASVRLLGV